MNACKEVFKNKIPIVADRYHVQKIYRKCLVSLRKAELKKLKNRLNKYDYEQLKDAIKVLRKQKDYFTEKEGVIVEILFKLSPKLKDGYDLSRQLTGIFNSDLDPMQAKIKMDKWISDVQGREMKCFNKFIKTLTQYKDQIANYFINGDTSGFVEGFNNKAKVLKRRCYGLSNPVKFFLGDLYWNTLGMDRYRT